MPGADYRAQCFGRPSSNGGYYREKGRDTKKGGRARHGRWWDPARPSSGERRFKKARSRRAKSAYAFPPGLSSLNNYELFPACRRGLPRLITVALCDTPPSTLPISARASRRYPPIGIFCRNYFQAIPFRADFSSVAGSKRLFCPGISSAARRFNSSASSTKSPMSSNCR